MAGSLSGQEAGAREEEVFELPEFRVEVDQDRGYITTNSISGSVINTLTRDLPFSLQVINGDLIEDLQASDLTEALQYSAGVFTQTFENTSGANETFQDFSPSSNARANDPFADRVVIRGYPVPNQQRYGFRIGAIVPAYGVVLGGSTDTSAVERFEVVKGPSSLLYGISVLSGVVNLIPKRPMAEPRYEITASAGDEGYFRTTLDATGPLIEGKLNYRVIGAFQENGDWTDFHEIQREFATFQLDWKITPKLDLYVDVSAAVRREDGLGPRLLQDGGARGSFSTSQTLQGSNNAEYVRNQYGEFFTWGLDFDEEAADIFLDRQPDREYEFPDLGYGYRISGPDTFREQEEFNTTALLTFTPTNHLRVELGVYYSDTEESNRLVDMSSVTGGEGRAFVGDDLFDENPEYDDGRLIEVFPVPSTRNSTGFETDEKFARYYWYSSPISSESLQIRGRGLYSFDKDIFGVDARHNLIAGYSFIGDDVSFISDNSGAETLVQQINHIYTVSRQAEDPYVMRNIFNYEPIRYQGEPLAIVGDLLPIRNVTDENGDIVDLKYLRLSGQKDVKLWYKGLYGIYHGEFMNGRATFIGGIRRDSYQVKESEALRILDRSFNSDIPSEATVGPFTDIYNGSGVLALPYLIGNGSGPYREVSSLPQEYHELVRREYELFQKSYPSGTAEHNFDEPQEYITKSAGLSVRLTEAVSVYTSYAEGIFPNTGLRDGNYDPIPAEETQSAEIGIKVDLETRIGRFSGDVAFYRMRRENAVTYWDKAPNPGRWYGGDDPIDRSLSPARFFDPLAARGDTSLSDYNAAAPVSYGVALEYVRAAAEAYGLTIPVARPGAAPTTAGLRTIQNGFEHTLLDGSVNAGSGERERYYYFKYTDIIANEAVKHAFDLAIQDQGYSKQGLNPIDYSGGPDPEFKNNPSNPGSVGAFVTYEEEETGVDLTLFYEPTPNYQIVFGFSKFDREITGNGFNMVLPTSMQEGDIFSTEYDIWVYVLGRDAFDDPTDPRTTNGKGINGVDLAFVPHTSATLWNKYQFREGPLEGLEIGGGVIYYGETPTSTTIGGNDLQINQFRTPDLPSRYSLDALLSYKFDWADIGWKVSLRVSNLTDKRRNQRVVTYYDDEGEPVKRRSLSLLNPRSFRLLISASF